MLKWSYPLPWNFSSKTYTCLWGADLSLNSPHIKDKNPQSYLSWYIRWCLLLGMRFPYRSFQNVHYEILHKLSDWIEDILHLCCTFLQFLFTAKLYNLIPLSVILHSVPLKCSVHRTVGHNSLICFIISSKISKGVGRNSLSSLCWHLESWCHTSFQIFSSSFIFLSFIFKNVRGAT